MDPEKMYTETFGLMTKEFEN